LDSAIKNLNYGKKANNVEQKENYVRETEKKENKKNAYSSSKTLENFIISSLNHKFRTWQ